MNEFEEAVFKYSKIDKTFLIIAEDGKFPRIETGILFILATWSGPSLVQFGLLTETLSNLDLNGLKLHVWDTDDLILQDLIENGISIQHGWGETYWIKNHKTEHFMDSKERDVSKIVAYTNELLT